jgi:hypothetical protein
MLNDALQEMRVRVIFRLLLGLHFVRSQLSQVQLNLDHNSTQSMLENC